MKTDLIQLTLNEQDQPVLKFSASESEKTLEQKILGAFLRKAAPAGICLKLVRTYKDSEEKLHYDYEILAITPEPDEPI